MRVLQLVLGATWVLCPVAAAVHIKVAISAAQCPNCVQEKAAVADGSDVTPMNQSFWSC